MILPKNRVDFWTKNRVDFCRKIESISGQRIGLIFVESISGQRIGLIFFRKIGSLFCDFDGKMKSIFLSASPGTRNKFETNGAP